jgi:pimeloyl-ACP methyl ester carboxylesterase
VDFLQAGGHRLEYHFLRPEGAPDAGRAPLVFLHEGLGSVALWKDFPAQVVSATGAPALVYSRYGYGKSDRLAGARGVDYMHREALEVLPELLDTLSIRNPVLIGHSDGASIALIHAGSGSRPVRGLVLMAPHVFVEDITVKSIAEAKIAFENTGLPAKLARYHDDAESTFRGWNDIWLHPDFRRWNIEEYVPRIACPVLAIQGEDDEYGTMDQLARIAKGARDVELVKLEDCRHSPHRDQPDAVLEAIARFVDRIAGH